RERDVGVVDPLGVQAGLPAGRQNLLGRVDPVPALRVGVVVLALGAQPVIGAVAQQPLPALGVAVDVGAQHVGAVLGGDAGQLAALQHADLTGGVARGGGADVPGLHDDDVLAGPRHQHRGGESGDPRADHHDVGGAD